MGLKKKCAPNNICTSLKMASGTQSLKEVDPELYALINEEKHRQKNGIELIASENFTSRAVMECLGSCLTNKYSEGLPNARFYGGNETIDKIEVLCQNRCLKAFGLTQDKWSVNVQPYSGSPANFAVYTGLLSPHDRIMGLDLPSGGHLTHGFYTPKKKVSATSIFFESMPYFVDIDTGYIDYDKLLQQAKIYRPKLIIAGTSAYARALDFKRFRQICDEVDAYLMCDIAHICGLVAAGLHESPFPYADIVTTTTHKSLRGPRSGVIFTRRDCPKNPHAAECIDAAVFPGLQGGPHNHQIAAIATQMNEVSTPEFTTYCKQVISNSQALGEKLKNLGYTLVTGGTDNHLILWDLRPQGLTGGKIEKVCDHVSITLNKNCVPGDVSAMSPSGVRLGTPAMTTRGLKETDMETIAQFLHKVIQISIQIQEKTGKKLTDFIPAIAGNEEVKKLKEQVEAFASKFDFPGI